jgi:hypothetical protein
MREHARYFRVLIVECGNRELLGRNFFDSRQAHGSHCAGGLSL